MRTPDQWDRLAKHERQGALGGTELLELLADFREAYDKQPQDSQPTNICQRCGERKPEDDYLLCDPCRISYIDEERNKQGFKIIELKKETKYLKTQIKNLEEAQERIRSFHDKLSKAFAIAAEDEYE